MTTLNEAREAVYQRFVDNYTTTPFTFENEDFDPPETAWVRLFVRSLSGGQETLGGVGGRRFRRRALVGAQVFTPLNAGMREGDVIAQEILELFEAVGFSGLDANDGIVRESPPGDEWIVHIVEIFFEYEETK